MKIGAFEVFIRLCLLLVLIDSPCVAAETVFRTQFEGAQALDRWTKGGTGEAALASGFQGSQSLRIDQKTPGGTETVSLRLPVEKLRDAKITVKAMIKAVDVAKPPQPYNGVKLMLVLTTPESKQYPAHTDLMGTFDWQSLSFQTMVPKDASDATLVLGLEATTGQAWFDDVQITVDARAYSGPPLARTGPIDNGHPGIPRLRGTMVSTTVSADDLRVLGGQWRANLIRYQLYWIQPNGRSDGWRDPVAYDAWLEKALEHLDSVLPVCRAQGLRVVVDLHSPPGGNIMLPGGKWPLFQERAYQDHFLQVWDKLARRYKGNKTVWGYDLANEPIVGDAAPGLTDWRTLATRAAQVVRKIDPDHAIIVEAEAGQPFDQFKYFPPIPVRGVVYSIHLYEPGRYTMQGVGNIADAPIGPAYPGIIGGVHWDKAQLAKVLQPVVDYQKHYGVAIYVGEFSAIRWAPGAKQWLSDAIDLFEQNGWDWSYHAFREWQGWSVEYDADPKSTAPTPTPTDRETLLRAWFAKNAKPRT